MSSIEYISRIVSEKTDKKSIKNAYESNDLSILSDGHIYYFERIPSRIYKTVKNEMSRLYPDLVYLYDIKR